MEAKNKLSLARFWNGGIRLVFIWVNKGFQGFLEGFGRSKVSWEQPNPNFEVVGPKTKDILFWN